MKIIGRIGAVIALGGVLWGAAGPEAWAAQSSRAMDSDKARVVEHWTPERRAAAIPRDLVIDPRGFGYLRRPDGTLSPHGHEIVASAGQGKPAPAAAPGSGDTIKPTIGAMDPAGKTIGASYTFTAVVTDNVGVKSVTFKLQKGPSGTVQSFAAVKSSTADTWSLGLSGFTDGDWTWWVEAKDGAPRGGNLATSSPVAFLVNTGGSSGGGTGDVITNAHWTTDGAIASATGRLYFEMPSNRRKTSWSGYVCSGTVVTDETADRSVILTAAHCVYDDVNKAFARNVMFIPDQDASGTATDRDCMNDRMGCWVPSFGFVDTNWTTRKFPDNIAWDYGYYAVRDTGAHRGTAAAEALDVAAGSLPIKFGSVYVNHPDKLDYTHGIGYSYNEDPKLMYCAADMTTEGAVNWWLPSCGLSGGSSGGPWIQNMATLEIISVNSWGYTTSPGMAGPKFLDTSAECVFNEAKSPSSNLPATAPTDGSAGTPVTCP